MGISEDEARLASLERARQIREQYGMATEEESNYPAAVQIAGLSGAQQHTPEITPKGHTSRRMANLGSDEEGDRPAYLSPIRSLGLSGMIGDNGEKATVRKRLKGLSPIDSALSRTRQDRLAKAGLLQESYHHGPSSPYKPPRLTGIAAYRYEPYQEPGVPSPTTSPRSVGTIKHHTSE